MKRNLLFLLVTLPAVGGDFINLTFDEPDLSGPLDPVFPGGPLRGSVTEIIPGWSFFTDGQPVITTTWSPFNLGSGGGHVSLVQNSLGETAGPLGKASLVIQSQIAGVAPEIRLSQRGTIPADAAGLWLASGYVQAFADGKKIGEINPMTGPFIIDVSRFAGQEVNLEFLVESGWSIRFDILGFVPVPEPETWALMGTGLGALVWVSRNPSRRKPRL